MKKVLLFTGAGIGVPLNLPTTNQFNDDIKRTSQQITQFIFEYLGSVDRDIESILATLEAFSREVPFTEFLIPRVGGGAAVVSNIQTYKQQASHEISRIRKIIFSRLRDFKPADAKNLYLNICKRIKSLDDSVALSIITTNYDLTFESSFEQFSEEWASVGIKDVDYGFAFKYGRTVYDAQRKFSWDPIVIEYLKLHGSLDWHIDTNLKCSRAGAATTPDDPAQMPILYPGFKSVPENEPFSSLHSHLFSRLTDADLVLITGFAFRDSYINSIFENILRSRPELDWHCFDPMKIDQAPKDSMLPYFKTHYASFHHHRIGISISDLPFGDELSAYLVPR